MPTTKVMTSDKGDGCPYFKNSSINSAQYIETGSVTFSGANTTLHITTTDIATSCYSATLTKEWVSGLEILYCDRAVSGNTIMIGRTSGFCASGKGGALSSGLPVSYTFMGY